MKTTTIRTAEHPYSIVLDVVDGKAVGRAFYRRVVDHGRGFMPHAAEPVVRMLTVGQVLDEVEEWTNPHDPMRVSYASRDVVAAWERCGVVL
jgi:hypothetical protein